MCLTAPRLVPFSIQREWTQDGMVILRAEISLPQPVWEDRTARRIRRFYRAQARAYLRYCQRLLLPQLQICRQEALDTSTPFTPAEARLDYHLTYDDGRFLSLYTQSMETGLPAGAQCSRHGDTWDLASGYPAPLTAFCPRSHRKILLAAAADAIRQQEAAGSAQYRPDWPRQLRRAFNSRNYYLTAEGLVFFYPMYALAPPLEGIPSFTVPFTLPQN